MPRHRPDGFTLVEMMFAVTIFALVLGGIGTLLVGVQRLTRNTIAYAEMSVRMRELREKLLFHVAPPHDGKIWSGLLSGTDESAVVEGSKIKMYTAYGYDTAADETAEQRIELVQRSESGVTWLGNDGDRYDDAWRFKWLCPAGYSNLAEDWLDDAHLADANLLFITLEMSACGKTRRERVSVPVFGTLQATGGTVFHD